MPTTESSSAWNTFSMSRWAMTLPIVARRSPAMTTPEPCATATIVVPCGASTVMPCVAWARLPGSRSGAKAARKSENELLAGEKKALGSLPPSARRSMPSPCHDSAGHGCTGWTVNSTRLRQGKDASEPLGGAVVARRPELDVDRRGGQTLRVVAELPEPHVAGTAQHAAHMTLLMIVVDVLGNGHFADCADTALGVDQLL